MKDARLYLILDRQVLDYDRLFEILKVAVRFGVDIVQLRDKTGTDREILRFSRRVLKYLKGRIPFIINDRADLTMAAGADGVHLGQDDVPIGEARKILGKKKIIGVSCQTLPQARKAERDGADYIGFGSVFKTLTKPSRQAMDLRLLLQVIRKIRIPVFAIGGINLDNIEDIRRMGVKRVAVTRAISLAENTGKAAQDFRRILDRTPAHQG